MTHQSQSSELIEAVKLLAENGFQGMANAIEILLNEAMKLKRTEYLAARPYERSSQRRSRANGFAAPPIGSSASVAKKRRCLGGSCVKTMWFARTDKSPMLLC